MGEFFDRLINLMPSSLVCGMFCVDGISIGRRLAVRKAGDSFNHDLTVERLTLHRIGVGFSSKLSPFWYTLEKYFRLNLTTSSIAAVNIINNNRIFDEFRNEQASVMEAYRMIRKLTVQVYRLKCPYFAIP
jgi:hypothetical protein